jgi:hypothetical protein
MTPNSVVKSYLGSQSAFCEESGFNYFAFSVFDQENRFILSYCNNLDWLNIFQHDFSYQPPVKNIVTSSRRPLEIWDPDCFDRDSACYIKKRNEICQTRFMATFLLRLTNRLTAITLGSPYDGKHFQRFCDRQYDDLEQLFKESLRFSGAIQQDSLSAIDA